LKFNAWIGAGALLLGTVAPALAHFQMVYVEESALTRGGEQTLALVFTHPFAGGPNMEMGTPEAFYVVSQRGDEAEPVRTDLTEYLTPVSWAGLDNSAAAYEATLPANLVRSLGDYVFVLEPAPYYEEGEDKYIQQYTKMVMNVGGVPGNWGETLGLPAEIMPLDKPYANWTGGVFRGVVLADGAPVPFAEIEVEYLNHPPDLEGKRFNSETAVEAPHPSFETMSIKAGPNGEFTIGLPRAGWWGICALDLLPDSQFEGKHVSKDAVLWVQVHDMLPGAAE
jgi:cobalt/nickel transport protein